MKRFLQAILISFCAFLIGCTSTQTGVTAPAQAEEVSPTIDQVRDQRAQRFRAQASQPVPTNFCDVAGFAESWYASRFNGTGDDNRETVKESLMARGITEEQMTAEVVRRNGALVAALRKQTTSGKAVPSCDIDVFYQIEVIVRGKEVGGVAIPHDLAVAIAKAGRHDQPYLKDLRSKDWKLQEEARESLLYFANTFSLTPADMRLMGVSSDDVAMIVKFRAERDK